MRDPGGIRRVVCWCDGAASPPPAVDGTAGTAQAIAAASGQSCAIQAGTGAVVCKATPPPAVDGTDGTAVAVAVGVFHSCAIESDGTVICWGSNDSGQCTPSSAVDGIQGSAEEIAGGAGYSLAIAVPERAQPLLLVTGALVVPLWPRRALARTVQRWLLAPGPEFTGRW